MPIRRDLKHFLFNNQATSEKYTSTGSFGGGLTIPDRPRRAHARKLLSDLRSINSSIADIKSKAIAEQLQSNGVFLEFSGKPGFDLDIEKLNLPSKDIELVSVKKVIVDSHEQVIATVFVPDNKLSVFIKRVEQYRDEEVKSGKPKNSSLVNGIESIRFAVLRSFWTDLEELFPQPNQKIWWEIWLRSDVDESVEEFRRIANIRQIIVSNGVIDFPDRRVILAYCEPEKLSASIESFELIAELRRAKETVSDFLSMYPNEQREWINALIDLTDEPNGRESTVCILDTGISQTHPLIQNHLNPNRRYSIEARWGLDDHEGHGSAMAGIVLYRDLSSALTSTTRIQIPCRLESVKLLPPEPEVNDPKLYGRLTEDAVSLATIGDPLTDRIISMAVTAIDGRDRGQPSSWSAALDKICSGISIENTKHLFIVSSGNTDPTNYKDYPNINEVEGIHDPAQSWNALTVGAFTEKIDINDPAYANDFKPLAEAGDFAPSNTTSLTWERSKWPLKPDVVFEGGNAAIHAESERVVRPDSMLLLSTNRIRTGSSMFTWMGDTSAATAEASFFAATLAKLYPNYWPETIRALIVHSAYWTQQMMNRYPTFTKNQKETLLRCCGYGVPDLGKALYSASNTLTMIAQDSLQPFDGNSMNEMNFHSLPWPTVALEQIGDTEVKMRVTLSYFIEPYPARRGWTSKFKYQSHGLRFEMQTAEESEDQFKRRINRARWDEEAGRASVTTSSDADEWYLGPQLRTRGSIHSDIWIGKASDLAKKKNIAVFPVIGWWREKHREGHSEKDARYTIIVSIESPSTEIDLYTEIETGIAVTV